MEKIMLIIRNDKKFPILNKYRNFVFSFRIIKHSNVSIIRQQLSELIIIKMAITLIYLSSTIKTQRRKIIRIMSRLGFIRYAINRNQCLIVGVYDIKSKMT